MDGRPGSGPDEPLLDCRYRLVRRIASGGMAEVWEGHDEVLTRPVAVKVLHPHLAADGAFRERFRREAVSAARLAHPNVVSTFDTGEDAGTPYIVMELVAGRTLRQLMDERGPLPPALAVTIAVQVADALGHAHEAGIVHRDVKPANILLSGDEPVPRVKVADFGIARAATGDNPDLTKPGTVLGTVRYLSPEQVRGGRADARSDLYALGVVLYEMLTGRAPFDGESAVATALSRVEGEPLRPRQLRAGIPRRLEMVVLRAMAKEPADRYESASEMRSALLAVDLGADDAVPTVVRDPTPPEGAASFRATERSWLLPATMIVAAGAALVFAAVLFARSDAGQDLLTPLRERGPAAGGAGGPITIAGVRSFDPQGPDGEENEDRVRLVIDGNSATGWSTDRYATRDFGRLKAGVGLVVELAEPARMGRLRIESPTQGWDASIFVADRPRRRLEQWGDPVAKVTGAAGSVEVDLRGARGRAVLVWLTQLGSDNRVEIDEVSLER